MLLQLFFVPDSCTDLDISYIQLSSVDLIHYFSIQSRKIYSPTSPWSASMTPKKWTLLEWKILTKTIKKTQINICNYLTISSFHN